MEYIPHKNLSIEEVEGVLGNPERLKEDDFFLFDISLICMAGHLYTILWTLTLVAYVLVNEYLKSLPNSEVLLKIFRYSGTKYVGKVVIAFGVELDEVKEFTPEINQRVVQVLFEKMICAVNEDIYKQGGMTDAKH